MRFFFPSDCRGSLMTCCECQTCTSQRARRLLIGFAIPRRWMRCKTSLLGSAGENTWSLTNMLATCHTLVNCLARCSSRTDTCTLASSVPNSIPGSETNLDWIEFNFCFFCFFRKAEFVNMFSLTTLHNFKYLSYNCIYE